MSPIKIVVEATGKCVGYACKQCQTFHTAAIYASGGERAEAAALDSATRCCVCQPCSDAGCPNVVERGWTLCASCRSKEESAKEQRLWDAAKKVPLSEYAVDCVFRDGFGDEGYIYTSDLDEEEDDEGPITWVWGCKETKVKPRLESYVSESLLDDHHEEAADQVDWVKVREAEALLVEACSGVTSFHQDYSVVVVIGEVTS